MKSKKLFYFKIEIRVGDNVTEFSYESDSSKEARKKKEELYALFYSLLPTDSKEIKIDSREDDSKGDYSIVPIEVNIKLHSEESHYWKSGEIAKNIDSRLFEKIKNDTTSVFNITPREFEKIVAEIYYKMGYDVELTPAIKDGGKDIIITSKDKSNPFVHFVECKRYSSDNPIGVKIVREFCGVVGKEKGKGADAGIIVTTSNFTRGAEQEKDDYKFKMELQIFNKLFESLL
ncbi:hypothetical protein FACS1894203_3520 [Bacteroidia bacterium]|nr:hypothetical protein FACS1894203_3520 [Bacteroidia bacterium]